MRADLTAAQQFDPTVTAPRALRRYQEYLTRNADTIPGTLTQSIDDEITEMISEVNQVHDLRPDNPLGAPAALPPEASLLALDPEYLARDLAHELNAHVRLEVTRRDGTRYRRWVDPSGRIHAFDPVTFNDVAFTANDATNAGLWPDRLRRDATDHGLTALELGSYYRTSWGRQQTFAQAVSVEVTRRHGRLAAVHAELPGLFARAQQGRDDWAAEVARVEQEQRDLAADTTVTPGVRTQRAAALGRRLVQARAQVARAEALLGTLRTTVRGSVAAGRTHWNGPTRRAAEDQVTDLESLAEGRRVGLAYRQAQDPTVSDAITALHRRLNRAGTGSVALAATVETGGDGGRFIVVNDDGEIKWFESPTGLLVDPPDDADQIHTLEMGPDGTLLDPPAEMRDAPPQERSFHAVRDDAIHRVRHQVGENVRRPDPMAPFRPRRPALPLVTTAFELGVAAAPVAHTTPATPPAPQILGLPTVQLHGLPADPHVYEHVNGRHGIGTGGLTEAGWRRLGPLSDYTALHWLTQGAPDRPATVADVARTGLGQAVRFLSGSARLTIAERVGRAFHLEAGFDVELTNEVPAGLPPGTWLWFTGPEGAGTAVVTPAGYRVFIPGDTDPTVYTEQQVRTALNPGGEHTIVIGRAPVRRTTSGDSSTTGNGTRGGGSHTRGSSSGGQRGGGQRGRGQRGGGTGRGTGRRGGDGKGGQRGDQTSGGKTRITVDDPAPGDPHLYVNDDGSYRVTASALAQPGWTHLGAISAYAPVAWLLGGGQNRVVTGADVVLSNLNEAVPFVTEVSVLGEQAETVRSLLAGATGRTVELTTTLPPALPPGTMIYFTGRGHTGAAMVLKDGSYRRTVGGATLVSPDRNGLAPVMDGRHTFVIARPKQSGPSASKSKSASGTSGRNEVENAANRAMMIEAQAFDPARLEATLLRRGLEPIEVPMDNNCFYHSLIAIAGRYLAQHVRGLRSASNDRKSVQILRNWLADRLAADLEVAAHGLPSRYANFFHVEENGPSVAVQQRALVNQIRTMDVWANEAGDLVAHLAASELGLPLTLVQDRFVTALGPEGTARINFIRTPGHFRGAQPVDEDAPEIAWETLRPVQAASIEEAQRVMRVRISALERRFLRAIGDFRALQQQVQPALALTRRTELDGYVQDFRTGRAPGAHPTLHPHLRAQQRLDDMGRATRALEGNNRRTREGLGAAATGNITTGTTNANAAASTSQAGTGPTRGTRTQVPVTRRLVDDVNARLQAFGPGWTAGEVDAEDVQQALLEVPPGGPSDPRGLVDDLAHQIAFGEVPRGRGGARFGEATTARPGPGGIRPMDRVPPAGKGKGTDRWHTVVRPATDRAGTQRYRVSDGGWIELTDGRRLSPDAWARYGQDFVHVPTGMYLRGEDGRVERADGWETLRDTLDEGTLTPHAVHADESGLYLTPEGDGPVMGMPLVESASGSGLAQSVYQVLSGGRAPQTPHPAPVRRPVDPSVTAARPETLGGGLPHAMKWRTDDGPLRVAGQRPPAEVFRQGLRPRGDRLGPLSEHVQGDPADSGYVSASRGGQGTPGAPAEWVYEVALPGGIDVAATLDLSSPVPGQEIVFPGGIHVRFIRGAWRMENGVRVGVFVANPDFGLDFGTGPDDGVDDGGPSSHGA